MRKIGWQDFPESSESSPEISDFEIWNLENKFWNLENKSSAAKLKISKSSSEFAPPLFKIANISCFFVKIFLEILGGGVAQKVKSVPLLLANSRLEQKPEKLLKKIKIILKIMQNAQNKKSKI